MGRLTDIFCNSIAKNGFNESGILDAPRNTIDNCAVLVSRHGVGKQHLNALIVTLSFPNARSEYWRVLQDIDNVLGMKVASITIGALLLILWEGHRLNKTVPTSFYAQETNPSIEKALSHILQREIGSGLGYKGWIKASK